MFIKVLMMKRFSPIIRLSLSCCALSTLLFLAPQSQAAMGECRPQSGAKAYSFTFNAKYDDPTQNVIGKTILNANLQSTPAVWATSGDTYPMICECPLVTHIFESFISAELGSGLGQAVYSSTNAEGKAMSYYKVDDYLAVAAEVRIAGKTPTYYPIPFTNQTNGLSGPYDSQPSCTQNYGSGAEGKIHLYFIRPFVGTHDIPTVPLTNIRIAAVSGVRSPQIAATVTMNGSVTVPQSCDINPSPITIDFGDIMSSQFQTAGAMPDGFTPVNKQLTLACRNISDGVKVNLSFTATPDPNMNNALKTDNSDIAIMIKDGSGNVISPNNGSLPVNMTGLGTLNSTGQAEINVYPVNTTGKLPAVGVFKNASGTVKVEIQ
ncbi:fimbrial protein [Serratia sp. D1N4]